MTHARSRSGPLVWGLLILGGCSAEEGAPVLGRSAALEVGGECLIGDETLEHACLHANYGPFTTVTAQVYPGFVFSDINSPHTAFTVELPAAGSGFAGAVLVQPTAAGEFGFLLDQPMEVTLYDSSGAQVDPVGSTPGDAGICPQLNHIVVYALSDTETYTLALGSATASSPLLVAEYLGAEANCEVSCDPLTLVASRSYHPAAWQDAELTLDHEVVFELPRKLVVSEGKAGSGLALMTISAEGHEVVCRYRGNGRKRYVFQKCDNGAVPGDDMEADFLTLHVKRGVNTGPEQRTTVEVTLQPECEGGHEHDHEEE
jgi:hypothetical protein